MLDSHCAWPRYVSHYSFNCPGSPVKCGSTVRGHHRADMDNRLWPPETRSGGDGVSVILSGRMHPTALFFGLPYLP